MVSATPAADGRNAACPPGKLQRMIPEKAAEATNEKPELQVAVHANACL
jgi:hypothetical protein